MFLQNLVDIIQEVKVCTNYIETPIDNWDEIKVTHPLIVPSLLYVLIPLLNDLEYVEKCYIADNGLIRVNIKGITSNSKNNHFWNKNDIAIHPKEGCFTIIHNKKMSEWENKIVSLIIGEVNKIRQLFPQENIQSSGELFGLV